MKRLLILALTLFSFSELTCNDITWNSPITISNIGVDASDPQIVIDSSGNVTAAWVEGGFIKASDQPFGGSWSAITTLSNSGSSSPKLGVDAAGNVSAIWLEGDLVKGADFSPGGSWSAATTISGLVGAASTPVLAVSAAGDAVAVWVKGGLIETSTRLFGGSWSLVNTFLNTSSDAPRVAVGNGIAVITWHSVSAGQDQILASRATIGGSWGTVNNLVFAAQAGHKHNFPRVAVDTAGNAFVAWYRSDLSGSDYINDVVVGSRLLVGASAWDTPIQISTPGQRNPSDFKMRLGFDTNLNALVVWGSSTDGGHFNIESAVIQLGGVLNPSVQVATLDPYAYAFDLSINSLGCALIPYMVSDGSNAVIQAVETDFGGVSANVFTAIQTLSAGSDNGYPVGAVEYSSGTVNAAVAWINFDGSNKIIQVATGSKGIVAPPTSVTVVQSTNNLGVFTEYNNTLSWTASTDPDLTGYVIYRNGIFIAQLSSLFTEFVDHNQVQNGAVTYQVAAYDSQQILSPLITVSFP